MVIALMPAILMAIDEGIKEIKSDSSKAEAIRFQFDVNGCVCIRSCDAVDL